MLIVLNTTYILLDDFVVHKIHRSYAKLFYYLIKMVIIINFLKLLVYLHNDKYIFILSL